MPVFRQLIGERRIERRVQADHLGLPFQTRHDALDRPAELRLACRQHRARDEHALARGLLETGIREDALCLRRLARRLFGVGQPHVADRRPDGHGDSHERQPAKASRLPVGGAPARGPSGHIELHCSLPSLQNTCNEAAWRADERQCGLPVSALGLSPVFGGPPTGKVNRTEQSGYCYSNRIV